MVKLEWHNSDCFKQGQKPHNPENTLSFPKVGALKEASQISNWKKQNVYLDWHTKNKMLIEWPSGLIKNYE
jgi:hypothetical protein